MKFKDLAVYLDKLEKTSSRIEITKILSELFKKADREEIDKVVYLSLGGLAPPYKEVVFNIAERMMLQVITKAYGKEDRKVKALYKKKGDLGDVAFAIAQTQNSKLKTQNLTILEVYDRLLKIAEDEGEGSRDRKIKSTARLLSELDNLSARYVARIPVGNLRLGFSDKTILDALSWMEAGDKSAKGELERAYFVLPDVGLLAKEVKTRGVEKATKSTKPKLGIPVMPMLAQRLKSPTEMIEKMGKVAIEPKFDGLRIQLHYKKGPPSRKATEGKKGFVKAFTRNMNENSWMFPELNNIDKYVKANEIILDTEAVGVDEKRKTLANFQTTMSRRRKYEIEETAAKVPITFQVFDLLLKNGKSLLDKPYLERRKVLKKSIRSGNLLQIDDYLITSDSKVIEREMGKEVSEGLEGIMVKRANSRYIAGRTGWRWVKMKEAESAVAKLADTVDSIAMGYTQGKGKRAEFGVGQFLVGIKHKGKIKTITKVGTGLTDDQFRELKKRLSKLEVRDKPKEYEVPKDLEPDYWVKPELVVEIAADEITKSPKHTSGYALRFPRLVKFRDDKSINQATSISEVKKLFKLQKS
ncbi:MAG: ATP-dependent DNA ligase [Patescibacteria group bacterium]